MRKHLQCAHLFDGLSDGLAEDQTLVMQDGMIEFVGPTASAPKPAPDEVILNYDNHYLIPGLIDVHSHLAYGNAKTEEDIDLYAPVEFRALRGLAFAQRVLKAGYTSMANPGDSGRVTLSIRNAIDAGLFVGPRITTAGAYVTSRQGLTDWYPTWIGQPTTSIGHLVCSPTEAIEEIRVQVKDGVDFIKIAMDGDKTLDPSGVTQFDGLMAAFNQTETSDMITEAHRLGKKVAVHARGTEGTLYSARAGADLLFHTSWMDEAGLEAVLENDCALCPTLTLIVNNIEFSRPGDGAYPGFVDAHRRELDAACEALTRAREAGARFMTGTDSGFAVTPLGEWHAREIKNFVDYLGFSPAEALRCATSVCSDFVRDGERVGALAVGRRADIVVLDADPLADVSILGDASHINEVILGGETVDVDVRDYDPRQVSDFSYNLWSDLYTRERVAELNGRNW